MSLLGASANRTDGKAGTGVSKAKLLLQHTFAGATYIRQDFSVCPRGLLGDLRW